MARPQKSYIGRYKAVTVIQAHTRDHDGNLIDTADERTTGGRVVFYTAACGRCNSITLRRKSVVRDGFVCPTCDSHCRVDPPDPFKLTPTTDLLASQAMPSVDLRPNTVIFHLGTDPQTTRKVCVEKPKDVVDTLRTGVLTLTAEEHALWAKTERRYELGYLKAFHYKEGQLGEKVADKAPPPSPPPPGAPPQEFVEALQVLAETLPETLPEAPPPPPPERAPTAYDERILQYNEGYTENMTALATELALDPPPATWTTDGYLVSQWSMNVLKEDRQPLPKPHGWYKTFPTTPATSDARWLWMNNGDTTARDNALFDVSDLFDGFDE